MKQFREILSVLCDCMSMSGSESYDKEKLMRLIEPLCDKAETTALNSYILWKYSHKANAPTMLIDTHYDQIGMMVTGYAEGGFLSVTSVGGMDAQLLPASDVLIYGKQVIPGVAVSTPPHLRKVEDRDKLTPIDELQIDTGMDDGRLNELVPLGTPVLLYSPLTDLQNDKVAGVALDNKACVAAALHALASVDASRLKYNIALCLSAGEELGGKGAVTATYKIDPDLALCLDVNFAAGPGVDSKEAITMGEGPSVSLSVLTHRRMTKAVLQLAKEKEIPCQTVVEIGNLGTNGNAIPLQREGIATVNMSLPLASMHSPVEVISLADGVAMSRLLCAICTEGVEVK